MENDSFSWIDDVGGIIDSLQRSDQEPFCIDPYTWWDEPIEIQMTKKRKLEATLVENHADLPKECKFGSIKIPSSMRYTLSGPDSMVRLKTKSFFEICNGDLPTLYLAVAASWIASFKILTYKEWKPICIKQDLWKASILQQIMKMGVILKCHRAYLVHKGSLPNLKVLTAELCKLAGLDFETEGTFESLPALECLLGVNIQVLEAGRSSRMIRTGTNYDRFIYIYSVTEMINDVEQTCYHGIKNINVAFNSAKLYDF